MNHFEVYSFHFYYIYGVHGVYTNKYWSSVHLLHFDRFIVSLFHCFIVACCLFSACVCQRPPAAVSELTATHSLTHSPTHSLTWLMNHQPPTTDISNPHPLTTTLSTHHRSLDHQLQPLICFFLSTQLPTLTHSLTTTHHSPNQWPPYHSHSGVLYGHRGGLLIFMPRLHRLHHWDSGEVPLVSHHPTSEALSWFNVHWGVLLSFILPT